MGFLGFQNMVVCDFLKFRVYKGFLLVAALAFPPFNGVSRASKLRAFVMVCTFSLFIEFRDL